ncbi:MAG: PaaI family thioesterase [Sphingomonadaceae bacterium]
MTMTDAELLERMRTRIPPTAKLLGQELLALDSAAGTVRMRFFGAPDFCNPMGNVQGGFLAAMLDDAAAFAVIVKSGRRIVVPTIEFKVSFFAPARMNREILAEGRCLKLGRTIAFAESDLRDPDGKLLARLSTSCVPTPLEGEGFMVEKDK